MVLIQVDGLSGTGKSTLAEELRRRGYDAVDSDGVFAYFADSLVRGLQGARTHAYWDVSIASTVLLMITMVPFVAKRIGLKAG